MRSSKNRSRSKGNRNRSVGNIVNRVFDSSGPEGKVRGTPQQIIDKYNQLARDAQLGNDRVAAENFQQHAEHYLRLLGEAQREQEARREQQQAQQGGGQKGDQRGDQRGDQQGGDQRGDQRGDQQGGGQREEQQGGGQQDDTRKADQQPAQQDRGPGDDGRARQDERQDAEARPFDSVLDSSSGESDSTLVQTPENAPKPKRSRTRRPRKGDAEGGQTGESGSGGKDADGSSREAAE
jgi:hypothetical protein